MSSQTSVPLTIIVAATVKNGIGKNGGLPWPMLKKEMGYFARITKRVPSTGGHEGPMAQNVVIMGRKTWESIPPKFRPLKDRTNVVISSQSREALKIDSSNVIVAEDIASGLSKLHEVAGAGDTPAIGRAFVIGGSSIYEQTLKMPQLKHILLTRIHEDYDCDAFFPEALRDDYAETTGTGWQRKSGEDLRKFIEEDVEEGLITETTGDRDVQFEFQLHERSR